MAEITIRLSDTPNKKYGNPLCLVDGMVRTVKYTNEVKILLNEGVIEPSIPNVQDIPEDAPLRQEKYVPIKKKPVLKRFL